VSGLRRADAADFTVLDLNCDEFVLRDFGVDGGRSTYASTQKQGIYVQGGSRWQITNVHVRDCSGRGIYGNAAVGEVEALNSIRNCHVDGTGGAEYGIILRSQNGGVVDGCFVENVHGSASNVGIHLGGCSDTVVSNCRVRNCFTGVQVASGESVGSNNQVSDVLWARATAWCR
jgi:parallel beta-helix repeat protein